MKTREGYKVYPLTLAQRLHFYYLKYCPKEQVLNTGSSLTIQMDLDQDVFKGCIQETIARCDTMRLRFTHDREDSIYQYVVKEETKEIGRFDFTGWKEEDAEQKFGGRTEAPFKRHDSPVHHIVMIKALGGHQGLYICVGHMTMDTQSLVPFFRDVTELYASRFYDGMEHPKEMFSHIKQLKKDLVCEAGSRAREKNRQPFQKLIASSRPIFTDICSPKKLLEERKAARNPKLGAAINTSNNMKANITNFHLEGESSRRPLNFCEKYGISVTCPLLMGLRAYLRKEDDQDDISTTAAISRQATLSEKRCGRSRVHCFPFRAIVSREDTSMEGLLKIRDAQNQYLRHTGYSPSEYFSYRHDYYKLEDGQIYGPLSLTHQPLAMKYDGPGLDKLGDIKYKTARYSSGVAAHTPYLTVNYRAEDNDLDFGFEYQTGMMTPKKLEHIYYYLCRIIFRDTEDPEHPVEEIIEMA